MKMMKTEMEFVTFDAQDVITTSSTTIGPMAYIIPNQITNKDKNNWAYFGTNMQYSVWYNYNVDSKLKIYGTFDGRSDYLQFGVDGRYQLKPNDTGNYVDGNGNLNLTFVSVGEYEGTQIKEWSDLIKWIEIYGNPQ